jgi:hypothetical protein
MTTAPVIVHIQGKSSGTPARGLKMRPISRPSWITSQLSALHVPELRLLAWRKVSCSVNVVAF